MIAMYLAYKAYRTEPTEIVDKPAPCIS